MQAINADAPHPAAARLWEEFLYTAEAQNLWIKGGGQAGAVRRRWTTAGTIDPAVAANLPTVKGTAGRR